ncbi:hypothetical protein MOQ72_27770 [Saccharopolyspora sp. K220]|uniref:hypothetical protein n=1 Tax=Saccharopolyspora soli TaxID=2926618 RepID=UPI001F5A01A1|nr:hypothetical protein [Saccharopolyspora soli]MCI2421246.1 hypothetical protein [Saccharopolyspora soli]
MTESAFAGTGKSAVSCPAPGVERRSLVTRSGGAAVDEFLLVWFEHAPGPWCELADVLVLAEQTEESAIHQAAAVLRRFPGCLAVLTPVEDRYLAHTREFGTLAFPTSMSVGRCAELAHHGMLSGDTSDNSSGSSTKR